MKKTVQPIQLQVMLLTAVRTIMNTGNRMVYPFLAVFAGLGIDLASISLVMSVRSFTAMLNPFLAPIVEKRGRKTGMLMAIGMFIVANIALFLWPSFPVFFITQCISYLRCISSSPLPMLSSAIKSHTRSEVAALPFWNSPGR